MDVSTRQEAEKNRLAVSMFIPSLFVMVLWLIFIIQWSFGLNFYKLGILPRHFSGLIGIIFTPLIHGSWDHLFSNSVPLLILGSLMIYFYHDIAYKVFFWIWLVDGAGVWLFAREEYHIGASGLVYGMVSFVFFSGLLRKNRKLLAVSLITIFLYGSIIWGILPFLTDISWEAHLFGLLAGIFLSIFYLKSGPPNDPTPEWMGEENELDKDAPITIHAESRGDIKGGENDELKKGENENESPDPLKIIYTYRIRDEEKEEGD